MNDNATPENMSKLARLIAIGQPLNEQTVSEAIDLCVAAWEAERAHASADVCMWRDCEERNADLRKRLEAAERNHIERKHIDATPDDGYPIRILRAYRADCDMRWADTSDGDVGNPLTVALNEMQDKRAAILNKAIAALAGEKP